MGNFMVKKFEFKDYRIDYSIIGYKQAMQVLSNEQVKGEIICGNFF